MTSMHASTITAATIRLAGQIPTDTSACPTRNRAYASECC